MKNLTLLLGIWCIANPAYTAIVQYSELEELGVSCSPKDRCSGQRLRLLTSVKDRNCACDELCSAFGDCCADANYGPVKRQVGYCRDFVQYGGIYVKNTCSSKWMDKTIREKCSDYPLTLQDPVILQPVTSRETGITYDNYYCALCNDDTLNVEIWPIRLQCDGLTTYHNKYPNVITKEYIIHNLLFNEQENSWGIWLNSSGELRFEYCFVDSLLPEHLEQKIRLCKPNLVDECDSDWNEEEVAEKCRSYMSVVYWSSTGYKNPHCAICNKVNVSQLSCQLAELRYYTSRTFNPAAFSVLLKITGNEGAIIGTTCNDGAVFDHFGKKCRKLICGSASEHSNKPCVHVTDVLPTSDVVMEEHNASTETFERMQNFSGNTYVQNISEHHTTSETLIGVTDSNSTQLNSNVLTCLKILIEPEDYIIYSNNTVYIPMYEKLFENTMYEMKGTNLMVCAHVLERKSNTRVLTYLGYVTIIGLGISIMALVLYVFAYCLVSELQNLSGKNLLSLVISLLLAYVSFAVGQNVHIAHSICYVVALIMYYCFLSAFLWMSIIAFDVWRTIRIATTELRVTSGAQWKRFMCYSLYAWSMALFILVTTVVIEKSGALPDDFKPHFGEYRCWFNRQKALMFFFDIPVFVLIIINICLFSSSAKMIICTNRNSAKNQCGDIPRHNFKLFLRLAVIMGLNWVTGLVAAWVDHVILWYTFVILNTLQGLFIFLAFGCSKKVLNYFRARFRRGVWTSEYGGQSLNSGTGSSCQASLHSLSSSRPISQTSSSSLIRDSYTNERL